jgi:16S rRNA (cytidine1402-2'-O)-methyltransferase
MTEGALVVVGTPIGNLGDLSPRAREALSSADVIACEDTRRTGRLLQLAGLPKRPLMVANEHTELAASERIVDRVASGERVALVSDAGMPAVSDPGRLVVAAVIEAGLPVELAPGPTAVIGALVLSGLAGDRFVFEGFLDRKGAARTRQLTEIAEQPRATVLYESPKRVVRTLRDLADACGPEREVAVARELTKLHETVVRGPVGEVADALDSTTPKGEFVVVVSGAPDHRVDHSDDDLRAMVEAEVAAGESRRDAVQTVADATGVARRRVYDLSH